jgi:hypothetical protein
MSAHQGESQDLFSQLQQAQGRLMKNDIEIKNLRQQLKDSKEDSLRRTSALERRNLDLETDHQQLNAQYKLLNERSHKLK